MSSVSSQALLFKGVPQEIMHELIFSKLSFDDLWNMRQADKNTNKLISYHLNKLMPSFHLPKESNIKAFFKEQMKALILMQKMKDENLFIRSPMGSGKTLMGLIQAHVEWEKTGKITLIVATSKCLSSWLQHVKLCGWKLVKSKPLESDILVCHSSCKNHIKFLKENVKDIRVKTLLDEKTQKPRFQPDKDSVSPLDEKNVIPSDWKYGIIITTPYYLKYWTNPVLKSLNSLSACNKISQVIVDEAHTLSVSNAHRVALLGRNIFLSASEIENYTLETFTNELSDLNLNVVKHSLYDEKIDLGYVATLSKAETLNIDIPKCYNVFHELKTNFTKEDPIKLEVLDELIQTIESNFTEEKRIICFVNWNPKYMSNRKKYLQTNSEEFTFLLFKNTNNSALNAMRKKDEERRVLIVPMLSATEGVNLEMGDGVIYANCAHDLTPIRAKQCSGRVKRRNNPNKEIKNVYAFYPYEKYVEVKTRINAHIAVNDKLQEECIVYKSQNLMNWIVDKLTSHKIRVDEMTMADLFCFFVYHHEQTILSNFKAEDFKIDTLLRIEIMSSIKIEIMSSC
jgi:hypothetical protein